MDPANCGSRVLFKPGAENKEEIAETISRGSISVYHQRPEE